MSVAHSKVINVLAPILLYILYSTENSNEIFERPVRLEKKRKGVCRKMEKTNGKMNRKILIR